MSELPKSIGSGSVTIMGVELVFHMLADGRRIIEADSMHALFDAMAAGGDMTTEEAMKLATAIRTG